MTRDDKDFNWLINTAYIRDGDRIHSGEALLLACLVHTKGAGRSSQDMKDVQRLMRDINYKEV